MGPRCPDASARLRNTLSPGSHKSGFYVAMNRGKQWIYFRPQGNQLSLGPSPAIRSLNMAGLWIPCRPVSLTKTTPCLGLGEEIPPSLGPVAARTSPASYGRTCTGQPQRPAGPGWWSLPHHPILGSTESALGLGGALPTSPRTGAPPLAPSPMVASVCSSSPAEAKPQEDSLEVTSTFISHYHCITLPVDTGHTPTPKGGHRTCAGGSQTKRVSHSYTIVPMPRSEVAWDPPPPPVLCPPDECPCKVHILQTLIFPPPAWPRRGLRRGP